MRAALRCDFAHRNALGRLRVRRFAVRAAAGARSRALRAPPRRARAFTFFFAAGRRRPRAFASRPRFTASTSSSRCVISSSALGAHGAQQSRIRVVRQHRLGLPRIDTQPLGDRRLFIVLALKELVLGAVRHAIRRRDSAAAPCGC